MKKIIALTFFAIIFLGSATTQQRPTVNMEAVLLNTDPVPLQSGDDAEINFKIRNTGNIKAKDVKVQIIDQFPFQLKPDRKRNYSLGDVTPGQEYYISTEVLVAENAPDELNSFKIRITNSDFSIIEKIPLQVQSQDIELNIANLKTSPSKLTADMEDAKMGVEIVNNGEKTAKNVVVQLKLPESFQKTSSFSTRQALGNIRPGEVKNAEFNFDIKKTAGKGEKEIPAQISYSTGNSNTRIKEKSNFSFYLAGKPQFKILKVKENLQTGEKGSIRITVKNIGSEKSSSTRIRVLDSSDLPFDYSSASQYIGTLEPGKKGMAVFDITTESGTKSKKYLLDFEIRGVKGTEVYVEDKTIDVNVQKESKGFKSVDIGVAGLLLFLISSVVYYFREKIPLSGL